MRIAQLSQELEVLARVQGIARALEIVRNRRAKAYDPDLADLVLEEAESWWAAVEPADPWDAALAVAPPSPPLSDAATHDALLVLADFADLKSPWTSGHSRAVAALALEVCGPAAEAAALVHDLGCVAVPNTIWDKPGPLTRDERDRVETHALVTDQLLRRVSYTATVAGSAGAAHERVDGSGYHRPGAPPRFSLSSTASSPLRRDRPSSGRQAYDLSFSASPTRNGPMAEKINTIEKVVVVNQYFGLGQHR